MKKEKSEKKAVSLLLDKEVYKRLAVEAIEKDMSFSSLIRLILQKHVERNKK